MVSMSVNLPTPNRRLAAARADYAAAVAGQSGAGPDLKPRLEQAFARTPREDFLGPPPWRVASNSAFGATATKDPVDLYQNALVVIDAERGINNGEPFLHGQLIA